MPEPLTFADWIAFEAAPIVGVGLRAPAEDQADYMREQIEAALSKAYCHGRDGLSNADIPRAIGRIREPRWPS